MPTQSELDYNARFYEGKSPSQIAKERGVNVSAVVRNIARHMDKLPSTNLEAWIAHTNSRLITTDDPRWLAQGAKLMEVLQKRQADKSNEEVQDAATKLYQALAGAASVPESDNALP